MKNNMILQKELQSDVSGELESLSFSELKTIGVLINKFYSNSNGKPTEVIDIKKYSLNK